MPEDKSPKTLDSVWKEQPAEAPIKLEWFMNRRTRAMDSATRSEILISLGSALFFVAIMAWRFPFLIDQRLSELGFVAVVLWVLVSLYWFRDRIWAESPAPKDALALPGLEYYCRSLERRRRHLRSAWLWHGPLFLACVVFVAMLMGKKIIAYRGLGRVLPLILLLAAWTAFGFIRRWWQANELQREIDGIEPH